jgi:predicted metalloenzyme YecM
MKTKVFLLIVFGLSAIFSGSVFAQSWLSQLDLAKTGGNTRRINLLNFDRTNSNLPPVLANKAVDGFFTGITAQGSYRINLSREYVGQAPGSEVLPWISSIFLFFGSPITMDLYRLTLNFEIFDINDNLVKAVSKSENYVTDRNLYNIFEDITTFEMRKISKVVSQLITLARAELDYNASDINNRLKSASQSFDKYFDELSANIRNGTSLAIFPISGSDASENNRVRNELTRYFSKSEKNYFVANRDHIDEIIIETERQGSRYVDQNTAVRIGKFVGARVIIVGRMDIKNNDRQLFVEAIDIETTQTLGTMSVTY